MPDIPPLVYDDRTLSIVCPVCCAAITGFCLRNKSTGGMEYLPAPHRERVELAYGLTPGEATHE